MAPQPPLTQLPTILYHFATVYNNYILPYLPDPLQSLSNNLTPFLVSMLSAASNGDITSLAAFLLTVYLTLKIADYIRRSVIGWVIFLIKIAVILVLVQGVFYINRYGLQKALSDAEWVVGIIWGLVEDKVSGVTADNRTGAYGGFGNNAWSGAYTRGKQQVPVGQGRAK